MTLLEITLLGIVLNIISMFFMKIYTKIKLTKQEYEYLKYSKKESSNFKYLISLIPYIVFIVLIIIYIGIIIAGKKNISYFDILEETLD